ncbi:putative baseplate assembly protein [Leptolyngbya sp. AN03gr2]|uniref:putative baseplate assembly protein n=1 Tax=unclassified Leptolyngbya TaxID=2650499 RepID=UPI003D30EF9F
MQPPKIDSRTDEELIAQIVELAKYYTPQWHPDRADAGLALIRIFGRMAAQVRDRVNQSLDKHFLAFLDLIGTQLAPPQPARVPLTFTLAANSPSEAFVPARTRIAAPPTEKGVEEALFETDRDLIVIKSQLQAVVLADVKHQCWIDQSAIALSKEPGEQSFRAFSTDPILLKTYEPLRDYLYFAQDDRLTRSDRQSVTLVFSEVTAFWRDPGLSWEVWNGEKWTAIEGTKGTWQNGQWQNTSAWNGIRFILNDSLQATSVNGVTAHWLRVGFQGILSAEQLGQLNAIASIQTTVQVRGGNSTFTPPTHGFFNTNRIALNQDFYPFGEEPRLQDALYLSCPAFAHPIANITVKIALQQDPDSTAISKPVVAWEAWTGTEWHKVTVSAPNIANFTGGGSFTLDLPDSVELTEINGEVAYWIRARLESGDYGKPASISKDTSSDTKTFPSYKYENPTFSPPLIKSLTLSDTYDYALPLAAIERSQLYHNFLYSQGWKLDPIPVIPSDPNTAPTLYLGFDQPFPNRLIQLYFQVDPLHPGDTINVEPTPVQLAWQYSVGASTWMNLPVQDETQAFSERGIVQFIAPPDLRPSCEFGKTCYWLRVIWKQGDRIKPRLRRILTNTIWASQATTVLQEPLGSSNGNPDQHFRTSQSPVLAGQRLEVRELQLPTVEEQAEIAQLWGNEPLEVVTDATGQVQGVWVPWQAVSDFYSSKPNDRHYLLDAQSGEIRFGDGQTGQVPPRGRNNLRMAIYRTGGGATGNCAIETITQLKTTLPYVDRVTNLEPSGGGIDSESIDRVKQRGASILRHQNKAVTEQDIEDLTYGSSAEIARVKVLMPSADPLNDQLWLSSHTYNQSDRARHESARDLTQTEKDSIRPPGAVTVLIVPYSDAAQPMPSLALLDRVRRELQKRAVATLSFNIAAPNWVEVSVVAELVPVSLEQADAVRVRALEALTAFLHPLTGRSGGWAFGRQPQRSDLYAVLNQIEGVSLVRSLRIRSSTSVTSTSLIYSGTHTIQLSFDH